MSLGKLILFIVVAVVILVLILFPEARVLLSGFTRLFIKDMATTPDGAAAIYGEKIDEAEESHAKINDAFKKAAGRLHMGQKKLQELSEKLSQVESECEKLVKDGKIESAQLKAEEREEITAEIARQKELVKAYVEAEKTAREAYDLSERNLKKLKREAKEIVENMRTKEELKAVYDDMDELKCSSNIDKLLDSVREKNKDLDEIVEGSKTVHNNKLSTKLRKAEEEARKVSSSDYLEGLKKKYNK